MIFNLVTTNRVKAMSFDTFIDKLVIPEIYRNIDKVISDNGESLLNWLSYNISRYFAMYNQVVRKPVDTCYCEFKLPIQDGDKQVINVTINKTHTFEVDINDSVINEFIKTYLKMVIYLKFSRDGDNDTEFYNRAHAAMSSKNMLLSVNVLDNVYNTDNQLTIAAANSSNIYYNTKNDLAVATYVTTALNDNNLEYLSTVTNELSKLDKNIATHIPEITRILNAISVSEPLAFNIDYMRNTVCTDMIKRHKLKLPVRDCTILVTDMNTTPTLSML